MVFYGNEISLGAFFGSWLFWIAIGSTSLVLMRDRAWVQNPLPIVRVLILALPFLLALQIIATRLLRLFLDVSSTGLGLAFPLACKALNAATRAESATDGTVKDVSYLYIFEALGALLGGVLFTFVLIEWLGVWRSLGLVALLLAISVAMLSDRMVLRMAAFTLTLKRQNYPKISRISYV